MDVFVLWHYDEETEIKLLGVYSSDQNTKEAKQRFSVKPGFKDHLEDFHIDRYEMDKDWWIDGFE